MTVALVFRDSHALQVVVMSGLCPAEVVGGAAQIARGADGSLMLAPARPLPEAALRTLREVGVTEGELARDARPVRCWAEAIALERIAVPAAPALVLLVTERAAGLVELAAELVRLGCDRQELVVAGARGVIRVVDPPTYTVIRALDREAGLRGYVPDPAGQLSVWSELGHRHPLAGRLGAEPGTLLLLGRDGWLSVPDTGWTGLEAALELTVAAPAAALLPTAALPARRTIELRLARGRREPPSLWVVREGGVAAIDDLLGYLPDDVVERLTFAMTGGDAPIAIVRARAGRHAPPELALDAEAYAPVADMPDIYAPVDAVIEPPLRRDRLRAILTGAPAQPGGAPPAVWWLAAVPPRRFRVERIADTAFLPLAQWADYVLHASAPALVPWMCATELDFAPLVSTGVEWASAPVDDPGEDLALRGRLVRSRPRAAPEPPVRAARGAAPVRAAEPAIAPVAAPVTEIVVDGELAALETSFIELDTPGDDPARIALLDQLATAYARLGRRREAGLCFVRAVWDAPAAEVPARLAAWLAADAGLARTPVDELVAQTSPAADDVRVVAVIAALAPAAGDAKRTGPDPVRDPHRVQRWLDEHDGCLDSRTLWLARLGLARLAGGDSLGLAHTRDRILARLAGGLPVEHELPGFLRFTGRSGALGDASGEHLSTALEALVQRVGKTRRRRSPLEAPAAYTAAYAGFQLALGFARIGRPARARELAADAQRGLAEVAADPVHGYLQAAFAARIAQALAGVAPEAPLPDPVGAALRSQLAALDRVARYKVDRLREASRMLEPIGQPDAVGAFIEPHDQRSSDLVALRALDEPRARAAAAAALVDAAAADPHDRERLLDGVLEVLLELPERAALPLLARVAPLIGRLPESRRAVRYAAALVVAGHFGHTERVPELLARLGDALHASAGPELERVLHHSLRALRRIGLRDDIAELLARAEHALQAAGPDALHGRLALAGGLAFLGDTARALPIFAQARTALGDDFAALGDARKDRPRRGLMPTLELTRALALAYAHAPLGHALGGIAELAEHLRDITDTFGTNSHFCLSVLHFVESLVLGLSSDDLAFGDAGRRFVEDDEHLLRRRLHRDLGGPA